MCRAVLDPGVLTAALLSRRGAPAQLLLSWIGGGFELVVSPNLLDELKVALLRPKFRKSVTVSEVGAYSNLLEHGANVIADAEPRPRVTPDPGDDYLIALARVAAAHCLVSGDAHLMGLKESQPPIVTPRAFLSSLQKIQSPGGK